MFITIQGAYVSNDGAYDTSLIQANDRPDELQEDLEK